MWKRYESIENKAARWIHTHHRQLARFWFFFGIAGIANSFWQPFGLDVTKSIAVLFFVSVYANHIGHVAALEANPDEDIVRE